MKRMLAASLLLVQAALVIGLAPAIRAGVLPRGVAGEWEWPTIDAAPGWPEVVLASAGIAAFAGFAALGVRSLSRGGREWPWVAGLVAASAGVQLAALGAAPSGYGLAKWAIALHNPGASGYYTIARRDIADLPAFLEAYPAWIRDQDALHVGTHPPGLFIASTAMIRVMDSNPGLSRAVVGILPGTLSQAFRLALTEPLSPADRAALAATGFLTLLACAATVAPLYLLARSSLPPPSAWAAATLWPLCPAAILFGPAADTAFPLLSTAALALAAHAGRRGARLAAGSGAVLAVGMQFTLAFLPVGLVVALILLGDSDRTWRRRGLDILATGAGFLATTLAFWACTGANPFVIWWWNQANHARFYVEYPRSYVAWVVANPVETAVALGLPASALAAVGLARPRAIPRATLATLAVLVILNFSGRNLSEVARLWLPLFPPLLILSARGLATVGRAETPRASMVAAAIALTGWQVFALEATIQVVYPF